MPEKHSDITDYLTMLQIFYHIPAVKSSDLQVYFSWQKEIIIAEVIKMNDEDMKIYVPKSIPTEICDNDSDEVRIYPSVESQQSEHLP